MTLTNNITALEQAQAFAEIREQQRQEVLALIKEAHKSIKFKKEFGLDWHVYVDGCDMGGMHTQQGSFGKEWVTFGVKCNDLEWKPLGSFDRLLGHNTRLQLAKCIVHARLMMTAGFEVTGYIHY